MRPNSHSNSEPQIDARGQARRRSRGPLQSTCRLLVHCVIAIPTLALGAVPHPLEILVPAYFYPAINSPWNQLNAAATRVPLTAIMNPASGPGSAVDTNYVNAVNSLRSAGGKVIAYVSSNYANRPIANVIADIDTYRGWYNVDGFFIDEMSNMGSQTVQNYYAQIYNYVKSIENSWEVIANPGTTTLEGFLTRPTADRLVVFEGDGGMYTPYVPSAWNSQHDASDFVHLIHSEPSVVAMRNQIQLARQRNAGMIFITDDVLNNPWDRLPSYWASELTEVEAVNRLAQGDLNSDGETNCDDINTLTAIIASGAGGSSFDLNADGLVNVADRDAWLMAAGIRLLGPGKTFLLGDANLDGVVDGSDFSIWNSHKFTSTAAWCSGDFSADGAVDGSDFNLWNSHKFTSSDAATVPEPYPGVMGIPSLLAFLALVAPYRSAPALSRNPR